MAYSSWHSSQSGASLEYVPVRLYKTISKMIESTFDPCSVGRGRDAKDLDHCEITVTDIQRVNNRKLFRAYCDFKNGLREKTSDGNNVNGISYFPPKIWQFKKGTRHVDLNEIYLFHGTSEEAANSIIEYGFDINATDPNGMYGNGIYFAEEVTKADQYTDDKENREPNGTELTLLLCKVLMGNTYMCGKYDAVKWRQPPCMLCRLRRCNHEWQYRYDSVLGSGHDMLFREFVVYDSRQCFPEFLIKYERTGSWEPLHPYD